MVDLFLVHEQHVFELRVRGELMTPEATAAVVAALAHLPAEADVLLDLCEVTALDVSVTPALRSTILERRAAGGNVAVVTSDLGVRTTLAMGDVHHVAALAADRQEAFRLLPGRLVA